LKLASHLKTFLTVNPLLWILLLAAGDAVAQFEGIVESKNLTTNQTGSSEEFIMTIMLRNNMARVEIPTVDGHPGTTMIYRNDKHIVWMLNVDEKTYSEIPHGEEAQPIQTPDEGKYIVVRSGKTRKILGYRCEQETEIWGTRSLAHVAKAIAKEFGEESPNEAATWTNKLSEMGLFPLVSTTKIEGNIVESQAVTKIEQKRLPQDLFEIPSGFTKENVGKMLERIQKSEKK